MGGDGGCRGQRQRLALAHIEMELRAEQSLSIKLLVLVLVLVSQTLLHKRKFPDLVKYVGISVLLHH